MTRCLEPGCRRAPVPTSRAGLVHSCCEEHEREALSVFGERWHDQARAGVLRTAVVGGLPTSSGPVPGVETLSPRGLGHPQSAGAPVTSGPDRPLSVTPNRLPRRVLVALSRPSRPAAGA